MPIAFGHGPCDLDLASLVRDDLFTEQGQRSQCRTVKLDAAFAVVVYCLFQLAEGLHDHLVDLDSVNAVHRLYSFPCSFVRHHRSQAGCADRPAAAISDSAARGSVPPASQTVPERAWNRSGDDLGHSARSS